MKVIDADLTRGYPARKGLYYRCGVCGAVVESLPDDFASCACGNVQIDVGAARMSVKDQTTLEMLLAEP